MTVSSALAAAFQRVATECKAIRTSLAAVDAKLGSVPAATVKGRSSAGSGPASDLSMTTLASMLGFEVSLGTNGYIKLPLGLIIQWMQGSGEGTKTFPVAFPSSVYGVTGTMRAELVNYIFVFQAISQTVTGFVARPRYLNTANTWGVPAETWFVLAWGR